jgi:polar amino acid transport system substrate-binding protein
MKAWLAVLLGLSLSQSAEAMSLCVEDADYPPLLLKQDIDGRSGLLPDITRAAAAEHDEPLTLLRHPWKRCLAMLRKNQVDAIAASFWSSERDAWGAFPKASQRAQSAPDPELRLWREEYRVFVPLAGELRYDGQQFSGIKTGLGAPPGYVVWHSLKKAGVLNETVRSVKIGLQLVALNRLDGYVSERSIGLNMLRTLGLSKQVKLLPQTYYEDDSYLVFSHQFRQQNPQLTQAIWRSLPAIREQQLTNLPAE